MEKILVSACLAGEKVNYKGESNYTPDIKALNELYDLVLFCPEVEGGLPIPRKPNEIKNHEVFREDGKNVTYEFSKGAEKALRLCKYYGIKIAVLKEASPSCGVHEIHDGNFNGRKIKGMGVTAQLLSENGIKVYSEKEIPDLLK